jgi:hypothetical protein
MRYRRGSVDRMGKTLRGTIDRLNIHLADFCRKGKADRLQLGALQPGPELSAPRAA